ncbi:MAG: GTPase ObgE [Candidatus Krumholzibacteria bacterium]|nr:GTPase ObgE [Candidatus Krumholzibacteria bacterium]
MFIDRVTINVKAGKGGDGCVSFRREKFVPRGGPDGGMGGHGGDVIVQVDPQMRTLLDLYYRKSVKAQAGKHGQGKNMTGAGGQNEVIMVPPGTVVADPDTGETLADLEKPGASIVAARGGRGGKGNYMFRSPKMQAPRTRTMGEPGQERRLVLTMKLIADVGLVGLPNAGKSTLLRSVSDAHPVVAPYPFSTLEPVLGMVKIGPGASFCMVDIPGLIEGAHKGKGLGIQFLRHIERCRVLVFIIDAAEGTGPERAYAQLMNELRSYGEGLVEKPRLIALNKTDLLEPGTSEPKFRASESERVFKISALGKKGLRPLLAAAYRLVIED